MNLQLLMCPQNVPAPIPCVYSRAPAHMHSIKDMPLLTTGQSACVHTFAGEDRRTTGSGKHSQLTQNCYRAHTLCTIKLLLTTASFAIVPFWLRAIEAWLGVIDWTQLLFYKPCSFLDYARSHVSIHPNQNDTMAKVGGVFVCKIAPKLRRHNWPSGTRLPDYTIKHS